MNRAHYHPAAMWRYRREYRNGWQVSFAATADLRIGDLVLLGTRWMEVMA